MQFGLDVPIHGAFTDPRLLASLAAEAEGASWDGFFVQDSMVSERPLADPWIALAAIALRTQHVRIGAFLTALPRRRPWKVARETATLDHLSGGRLIFAAGLGFELADFASFGEETALKVRAAKLDEGLQLLDAFWSGEAVDFEGAHYQVHTAAMLPGPVQRPRIPIWLGGGWPRPAPFRRAARWDGVYVMTEKASGEPMTPDDIRDMCRFIAEQRGEWGGFEIALADKTPSDPDEAGEHVRPFAEAGVTWWLEGLWAMTPEVARERIQAGPPRI